MGLEGLGEQPVEDPQLLVPKVTGCFDVEAVLSLDPVDLGTEGSTSGVEQVVDGLRLGGCSFDIVGAASWRGCSRYGQVAPVSDRSPSPRPRPRPKKPPVTLATSIAAG